MGWNRTSGNVPIYNGGGYNNFGGGDRWSRGDRIHYGLSDARDVLGTALYARAALGALTGDDDRGGYYGRDPRSYDRGRGDDYYSRQYADPTSSLNSPDYLRARFQGGSRRFQQGGPQDGPPPGTPGYIDANGRFVPTRTAANPGDPRDYQRDPRAPQRDAAPTAPTTPAPAAPAPTFNAIGEPVDMSAASFTSLSPGAQAVRLINAPSVKGTDGHTLTPAERLDGALTRWDTSTKALQPAANPPTLQDAQRYGQALFSGAPAEVNALENNMGALYGQITNQEERTRIVNDQRTLVTDTGRVFPTMQDSLARVTAGLTNADQPATPGQPGTPAPGTPAPGAPTGNDNPFAGFFQFIQQLIQMLENIGQQQSTPAPVTPPAPGTPAPVTPADAATTPAPVTPAPAAPNAWQTAARTDAAAAWNGKSDATIAASAPNAAAVNADITAQLATMGFATDPASISRVEAALGLTVNGEIDEKLQAALDSTTVRADLINAGVHGAQPVNEALAQAARTAATQHTDRGAPVR